MSLASKCLAYGFFERHRIVAKRAECDRLAARFGDRGSDDGAVTVIDASGPEPLAWLDKLIAGRKHGHLRPPNHFNAVKPARRQHTDFPRTDFRAAPQQCFAARDVRAREGNELSRQQGTTHLKAGLAFLDQLGLLDHDHGIGAAWDDTAGSNCRARPCCYCFNGHMTAGNHFRIERQHVGIAVARARGVDRTHGKTVDIRTVERRRIDCCNYIVREHTAARIGELRVFCCKWLELEMLFEA
jgi:hypothetical protein